MSAKKSKKKFIILGIVLAVVILIIVLIVKLVSGAMEAYNTLTGFVNVMTVDYQDLSDSIVVTGSVEGISSTNVTSKAGAEVQSVAVSVGDEVNEGDILCVLDSTEIAEQIADYEVLLNNQNALAKFDEDQKQQSLQQAKDDQATQLKEAQSQIDDAVEEYNKENSKLSTLRTSLETKKQEQANAKTAMENAKAAVDAYTGEDDTQLAALEAAYQNAANTYAALTAEVEALPAQITAQEELVNACAKAVTSANNTYASIKTSTDRLIESAQTTIDMSAYQTTDTTVQKTLDGLEEQLQACTVYAPCSGVVTAVNVKVGDNNVPGAAIFTIEDTSTMKLTATVDEFDILKIEEGMQAVVTANALSDQELSGTVSRVVRVKGSGTGMDAAAGGYAVDITVEKSDLLVGMAAKAKIMLREKKDVLSLPYDAIRYDDDGQAYVLLSVENEDGSGMSTAVRKDVTLGEEINYYVEVTGGDIHSGDVIVNESYIQEGDSFLPRNYFDTIMEEVQ